MTGHKPTALSDIPRPGYSTGRPKGTGRWQKLLKEFLESGDEAWELETNGTDPQVLYRNLQMAVKHNEVAVKAVIRTPQVFIVRRESS